MSHTYRLRISQKVKRVTYQNKLSKGVYYIIYAVKLEDGGKCTLDVISCFFWCRLNWIGDRVENWHSLQANTALLCTERMCRASPPLLITILLQILH